MAIDVDQLEIIYYPDPRLRQKAKPVEQITDEVRAVAARMIQLMHQAPGVGLAAPQVGLDWRLFVCNPSGELDDDHIMVNPKLVNPGQQSEEAEEGCLSLPEVHAVVRRPESITIEATDLDGNPIALTSQDLAARIWQHEYDHLEGVMIIDRMAPIDRMVHRQLLREMEKDFER